MAEGVQEVGTYLNNCQALAPVEIRALAMSLHINQQRLDLRLQQAQNLIYNLLLRLAVICTHELEHQWVDLGEVCVDEEGHPVAEVGGID